MWNKTPEEARTDYAKHCPLVLILVREFPTVGILDKECISADIGGGWMELIRPALTAIAGIGGKVHQIKQKFGALRLYWEPPKGTPADARHAVHLEVSKAEERSATTCWNCGTSRILHGGRASCDDCWSSVRGCQ